jgi:cell division protein FtsB
VNKLAVFLLLLLGLLQYRLWFGDGNLLEFRRLNERIEELLHEGDKRRERNAALEAEVMDLKQGLDAIEERARWDLGMIKEGETFVQIIDPHHEHGLSTPPAQPAIEAEKRPAETRASRPRPRRVRPTRGEPPQPRAEPEQEPPRDSAPAIEPEEVAEPFADTPDASE